MGSRTEERLRQLLQEISAMKDEINVEHSTTSNSRGRISRKVTIEYDIQNPTDN